jgi:curved DNA-binding protein CbpA
MQKNYYEILGVSKDATEAEIRTAYRKMARIYHPDLGGSNEMMRLINEAKECLSDPDLRREHDEALRTSERTDGYRPRSGNYSQPFKNEPEAAYQSPIRPKANRRFAREFVGWNLQGGEWCPGIVRITRKFVTFRPAASRIGSHLVRCYGPHISGAYFEDIDGSHTQVVISMVSQFDYAFVVYSTEVQELIETLKSISIRCFVRRMKPQAPPTPSSSQASYGRSHEPYAYQSSSRGTSPSQPHTSHHEYQTTTDGTFWLLWAAGTFLPWVAGAILAAHFESPAPLIVSGALCLSNVVPAIFTSGYEKTGAASPSATWSKILGWASAVLIGLPIAVVITLIIVFLVTAAEDR